MATPVEIKPDVTQADDRARLDFVETNRVKLEYAGGWWYVSGPSIPYSYNDHTARGAIDAAMKGGGLA